MNKYTTRSEAARTLAAGQTHDDLHTGHGVISMPTQADIANRAYDIYVKSGCKQGHCNENWREAEHELKTANHRA
jgi:hypothetical protein